MLTVVTSNEDAPAGQVDGGSLIDEIVREGARRMLAAALEAEVAAYIAGRSGARDGQGRRLEVRNGHADPRQVLIWAGAIGVRAPRVNDKRVDEATGERHRFASAILPARAFRGDDHPDDRPVDEALHFNNRDLSSVDYFYLWADGYTSTYAWTRRSFVCSS